MILSSAAFLCSLCSLARQVVVFLKSLLCLSYLFFHVKSSSSIFKIYNRYYTARQIFSYYTKKHPMLLCCLFINISKHPSPIHLFYQKSIKNFFFATELANLNFFTLSIANVYKIYSFYMGEP